LTILDLNARCPVTIGEPLADKDYWPTDTELPVNSWQQVSTNMSNELTSAVKFYLQELQCQR